MSSQRRGKVLVLGHDTRSFLTVVRSLGRCNCIIHAATSDPRSPSLSSRYIKGVHVLEPYSAAHSDRWVQSLRELLTRERYDLVIPCHDEDIIPIQAHRRELEPLAKIYLLHDDIFEAVSDKHTMNSTAKALGINVPEFAVMTGKELAAGISPQFTFPLVVKPFRSFTISNLGYRGRVEVFDNPNDLALYAKNARPDRQLLVQEFFDGTGAGVEILARDGEVLYAFQHLRVYEWPKGVSSYRKSVLLDQRLLEASKRLIHAMKYTGVAMVEFKINERTNDWRFIEINGRFWGSLPLAVAAGADFPRFLYEMIVENRTKFDPAYKTGIFCRNLTMDLERMRSNTAESIASGKSDSLVRTSVRALVNILTLRERSDTITLDDPWPGIRELAQWIQDRFSGLIEKLRIRFLSLSAIRRRTVNRRIARRLKEPGTILFVCKGNICRSPFAHLYASTVLPTGFDVLSAGYYPVPNRPSPETAVTAAAKLGVQLAEHRSVILTKSMAEAARTIFVFDQENMQSVLDMDKQLASKTFFLGNLCSDVPLILRDPYGGDDEEFNRSYVMISKCVDGLKPLLS